MNERLQKIADDLGTKVYKDALHGQIAKDNFIYGVAQAEIEFMDKAIQYWDARLRELKQEIREGYDISRPRELIDFKKSMEK